MRTFACSDLHGRYDLFKQIQDFLEYDDRLFIIGDIFDRGPDGWKIYQAIKTDPRINLLAGNHELLAAYGLAEWLKYGCGGYDFTIWVDYNGGYYTFKSILNDLGIPSFYDFANSAQNSAITKLINDLKNLPIKWEYINKDDIHIHLVHSGKWESIITDDCLWDRTHLNKVTWIGAKNELIVHGHTPIELMIKDFKKKDIFNQEIKEYKDGAFWYCNDDEGQPHKVNLDTAARWSGQTVVLDLNTFDEYIFEGEKFNG